MCVYVYTCICVYVCAHICICIHVCVHTCVYHVCICMHVCICVCTYVLYVYTHMCVYMYTRVCACVCTCVCVCHFFLYLLCYGLSQVMSTVPVCIRALFAHPTSITVYPLLSPHPTAPPPALARSAQLCVPGQPCPVLRGAEGLGGPRVLISLGRLCFLQRQNVAVSLPFSCLALKALSQVTDPTLCSSQRRTRADAGDTECVVPWLPASPLSGGERGAQPLRFLIPIPSADRHPAPDLR